MRKIFIALLASLSVLGLASCGGETTKKIRIQYMGWDTGTEASPTLVSKLIEEYNRQSTDVQVIAEFLPDPVQNTLNNYALNESLPDIFLIDSVPVAVAKEWALDLTPYVTADPEWENVDKNLRDAITYEGRVFGMPSQQNYVGFLANYDLIDRKASSIGDANAEDIFYGGSEKFNYELFFQTIKEVKEIKEGSSVIGVNATGDMINWLPSVFENSNMHFVWDSEKQRFDYTGETIIEALTEINKLGNLQEKNTFNSYADPEAPEDPRIALFGTADPAEAFLAGKIGFFQGMTSDSVSDIDFNYAFVGYPNNRVVSAGDFLCVSRTCKNPELAYDVAKFLSFGAAGIEAKYKIVDDPETDIELKGLPVNTDPAITGKWFDYVEMNGVQEIYEKVLSGEVTVIVEGLKPVPGYATARYLADTGITIEGVRNGDSLTIGNLIWDVCEGAIGIDDYKSKMTAEKAELINKEIVDTLNKIKAVVAKYQQTQQPAEPQE